MPAGKKIRIGLNGFGRIGKAFFKLTWDHPQLQIVGINTRSGLPLYVHLLKYDSIYGIWDKDIRQKGKNLLVDGKTVAFSNKTNGAELPWRKLKVDVVIDATGKHRSYEDAKLHLQAGASYVIGTSPMTDPDITLVRGVNEHLFQPRRHQVISAASCTTVCSALTLKVLDDHFGIDSAVINTVHALTGSQSVIDTANDDLRKSRAAGLSIIPTSTGAAKTVDKLLPGLKGRLSALSLRVPISLPSIISLTAQLKKPATARTVNQAFRRASRTSLKGHLAVSDLPLVSIDFKQNPHGAIIDLLSTSVIRGRMVNVLAWYDNEWGYTSQVVKLVEFLAGKIESKS